MENTKKITKAMEMVAASKMRKAQERMRAARPYAEKVRNIAANLSQANPEYSRPFMRATDDAKAVGFIVVTTDKGLCGGLNTNVLRVADRQDARGCKDAGISDQCGGHRQQGPRLPEPHRRQGRQRMPRSSATRRTWTS